jgi:nicotinamidase/pyrazinamidase
MAFDLQPHDALLIVDVQRDFLPGGALGVPDGDAVVPVLNRYIRLVRVNGLPVFASRDWHPPNHCSFVAQGGPWPPHCIADSAGAGFANGLKLPRSTVVIDKGTAVAPDAYSAFNETSLATQLRSRGIRRLLIGGLATDYCVLNTVRDALKEGFEVLLLKDAIRAVNLNPGDGARAEAEMQSAGAQPITCTDIAE